VGDFVKGEARMLFWETTSDVFEALCDEGGMPEAERVPWRKRFGTARMMEAVEMLEELESAEDKECFSG
jgi:hypothetical protein